MPYRHGHYYLLVLIVLTVVAFWPRYFSSLSSASVSLHFHGLTATLWIAFLAFQSWAIHNRYNEWHRAIGIAGLTIFPFFFAGTVLITHTMAVNFAAGDLFDGRFGARFVAYDLIDLVAIAGLFWSGLRWRRKVHLHARYMFATVFFLLAPIFSRLLIQFVPGLGLTPPDFVRLPFDFELASFGAFLLALFLAWKEPKHGRPWLITAGLIGLQMVLFSTIGDFAPWEGMVRLIATVSEPLLFGSAVAVGAIISWLGWNSIPLRQTRVKAPHTADA